MANLINLPDDVNNPSYAFRSAAWEFMREELDVCRHVDGGYATMRDYATDYLPQHPAEHGDDYDIRLNRPVFFNGFSRTHRGLTGMVFRIAPVLDAKPRIEELWTNIDLCDTDGDVFLRDAFDDALIAGHGAILVDHPAVGGEERETPRSIADEKAEGLRPYWVYIPKDDLALRTVIEKGKQRIEQAVIRENIGEPNGDFGEERITQYRVFRYNAGAPTFELWQERDGREVLKQGAQPLSPVTEIPLILLYSDQVSYGISRPPLIDLAWQNVLHYQTASDMYHAAHMANSPILFAKGFTADTMTVGPNSGIYVDDPNADAKWLETDGASIGLTRQLLNDIEANMAVLGLNMLKRESRQAETAESKRLDKSEQDSALASAARSLQEAANKALLLTGEYMKESDPGTITISTDFMPEPMTPQAIAEYRSLVAADMLSLDTLWDVLLEGGALPDEFDWEMEKQLIDESRALGMARFEEMKAVEAEAGTDEEEEEEAGVIE